MRIKAFGGFTLAELLIALAILGVIATFTIPKIINAQQNQSYIAATKEVCATMANAYQQYQWNNTIDTSVFTLEQLIPSINYVAQVTDNTPVDNVVTATGSQTCGGTATCLKMHNGGMLWWFKNLTFDANGGRIIIYFDPDGIANYTAVTTGPGKSSQCTIWPNGRISQSGPASSWFSW
jgi:prepilin-type N-terminal cleavage/methylation domain-containing protein